MAVAGALRENREILAFVAGLAAAVLLSYFLVFGPKVKEIRHLQGDVASRQAEMGESLRLWREMVEEKGGKSRIWEDQIRLFDLRIPVGPETDRFMAEIGRQAVRHNLRAFRLSAADEEGPGRASTVEGPGGTPPAGAAPGTPASGGESPYGELKYRVIFLSGYKDMAQFVDEMPAMQRLVSLRKMSVREKEGEMETTLEISVYHRRAK